MSGTSEALEVIERQSAVLMRHFELLHRRGDSHAVLDRAEYLLLCTLEECGPRDINSLAITLGLDPSTAGRQVSVMQQAGLVERSPSETDRRRSIVTPTATGLSQMEETRRRRSANIEELLAEWSEEDLRTLGTMFRKYNRAVADRYLTGPATQNRTPANAY